ncbi:MAG: ATP-binding protein, partial [Pseudomonadota bacterium]
EFEKHLSEVKEKLPEFQLEVGKELEEISERHHFLATISEKIIGKIERHGEIRDKAAYHKELDNVMSLLYQACAELQHIYLARHEALEQEQEKIISDTAKTMLALITFVLMLTGALCFVITKSIVTPIRRLHDAAARIRDGDLSARASVAGGIAGGDEIRELAKGFNQMAEYIMNSHAIMEQEIEEKTRSLREERSALEKSEGRLKAIIDNAPIGVILIDDQKYAVDANYKALELLGKQMSEVVGMRCYDFFALTKDNLCPFESNERISSTEVEMAIHDRPVTFYKTVAQFNIAGRPHLIEMFYDITSRKKAEKKLRNAQDELDRVFQSVGDGMCVMGLDFSILRVNSSFETTFGFSAGAIVGKKCHSLWDDPACHTERCIITRILSGEERVESELNKKLANSRAVPCLAVGTSIKNTDGSIKSVVVAYKDLTHLKMMQQQLLQSEKMAAIGQLAAGVAHEINNPVGFVSSNLNTLDDYRRDLLDLFGQYAKLEDMVSAASPEDKGLKEALNAISLRKREMDMDFLLKDFSKLISECKDGARRIKRIVSDLREFSHAGEAEMTYTDINKNIETTINIAWNELKHKAEVVKQFGELPLVSCYPQQLNQVFMNILVNAAQAIEERGKIVITTAHKDSVVEIRFSDTGAGITKESLPKIFEPFFTTKPVGKGTGLGLHVAYNIVKKHNGNITVESAPGKGSVFTIILPVDMDAPAKPKYGSPRETG